MINNSEIKLPSANKTICDETVEQIVKVVKEVGDFFEWGPKTAIWLNSPNPMFGGLIPMSLILCGRGHKVLQFIEAAKEGNLE